MQIKITNIVCTLIFGFIVGNICEIENIQNRVQNIIFYSEYAKLVYDIRIDDNYIDCFKVARDIIDKSHHQQLTALEILSLSELVNKPQVNLHAEYIASLK